MSAPVQSAKPTRALDIAKTDAEEMAMERKDVFRRLLGYVKPYRVRLFWGILAGILSGVMNGILLLVIKTVIKVVLPVEGGTEAAASYKPFADLPILTDFEIHRPDFGEHEWVFILLVCLSIPLLLLIRGVFEFLHKYVMLWINLKVLYRLRDEVFTGLMRQSLSFYNHVKQGELIQTVANQTRTSAEAGANLLSALIQNPVSMLSIFVMLMIFDPLYTAGALFVFPLCIVPVAMISRRVRKAGGKEEQESEGLMVTLHESFGGVRLVKAHSREEYQRERFNQGSRKINEFIMKWKKAMEVSSPMVEIVGSLGISIGMVYAWITEMEASTFMTLNVGLMSIYPHAKTLSRMQVQLQKCYVAAAKVFGYIDAEPDVKDAENAVELTDCQGAIELQNVAFSYREEDRPALNGISLNFEPGKKYALVGQSGSGKSTILSLILRFYDPSSGSIRIDGRDIREYSQVSLRDQIGLVSQDTFLFHDTIENNIRYGHLEATREEIERAAKLAHAHEFIIEQTMGYETILGDKGCTLSGGQQQRVSIARAILRNAPILFLDEATSALDSESEKAIQDALEELSRGKTVIAIAHRLSTVLDSDEIVVMREGNVLDMAPHAVLLERCEEYRQLYRLQFEGN